MAEPMDIGALQSLYANREAEVRHKWNRSLPFGELVGDRWERAHRLGFGEGASIYDSAIVLGSVQVGSATWIGPHVILDGSGSIVIGSTCSISAGVHVYSHDSVAWAVSGGKSSYIHAPVRIGDRCYIGPLTVIARGVSIGDGCIIGAHSLVLSDVPAGMFAAGVPAQIRGRVILAEDGSVTIQRSER
jgi:acetyltransferase-like isoleucine patch superfamily enzyme